jgi:hypothetical protein
MVKRISCAITVIFLFINAVYVVSDVCWFVRAIQ